MQRPELRKDALKVISFGLTKCSAAQAVEFVESTKGLAVLFGLWMKQPESVTVMTNEHAKLHEYFLSIFWNILSVMTGNKVSSKDAKTRICAERLAFKFVENRFEKLVRLVELHKVVFSRIREFDLSQFAEAAEIQQLEEHFNLDLLILTDSLIATLSVLTVPNVKDGLVRIVAAQLLDGEGMVDVGSVLGLQALRCGESDQEQAKTMQALIKEVI